HNVGTQTRHATNDNLEIFVRLLRRDHPVHIKLDWHDRIFGAQQCHWRPGSVKRCERIPQLVIVRPLPAFPNQRLAALGTGGKHLSSPPPAEPATARAVLSFASSLAGFVVTYSPLSSDFTTYFHPKVSSLQCLGAAVAVAAPSVPDWDAGYAGGNVGGLLEAMLHPTKGFGKFLTVLLSLSVAGNLAATFYSFSLNIQVFVPLFVIVPRYVFSILATAIIIPLAIVGATSFYSALTDFLGLIGYWASAYAAIILVEHLHFRKNDPNAYNVKDWNVSRRLPTGIAAIAAGVTSFGLVVPGMDQVCTGMAASRRLRSIHNHTAPLPEKIDGLVLVLPKGDRVFASVTANANGTLTQLRFNKTPIVDYHIHENVSFALELSAIGTRYEGATKHIPKSNLFELSSPDEPTGIPRDVAIAKLWAAIYALFTLYRTQEHILIRFASVPNAEELMRYLSISGLGRLAQGSKRVEGIANSIFLSRAAFWQGAGTTGYHGHGWLLTPAPVFPNTPSFTRSDMVIAAHPLRPPKPRAGEVLYRRYCSAVGKSLEFIAFDVNGNSERDGGLSQHMAAFHKWHNDERVNSAWGERGSLETHRDYVEGLLADPGVVPIMMSWDGELMGYVEIVWAKENHVSQYYPADCPVGDWERGLHVLVGEDKFLGGSELWLRSLAHYLFLADPRTHRVVGEPKAANVSMVKAAQTAGYRIQAVRACVSLDAELVTDMHDH
ncbi:hypothetical protein DXG01_015748, partial [Tephrocybe rancida]